MPGLIEHWVWQVRFRVESCLEEGLQHAQQLFIPIGHATLVLGFAAAELSIGHPQIATPIEDWIRNTTKAITKRVADCIA